MRTILIILAVLLFAGWILCEVELSPAGGATINSSNASEWRHTDYGWERIQDWKPITTPSVELHPGVVGLFFLFISVFSLIGFEEPHLVKHGR